MTVKTITITEEAYNEISRLKHEGESFSDLFKRIGSKALKFSDIAGLLKQTHEESAQLKERVRRIREDIGRGFERRAADVRTRLQRAH